MRLPVLFFTAIITPVLLCAALLVPSYAGIYSATYWIYQPEKGPNPMADKYDQVFTVLESYQTLLEYWMKNREALDFVDYTLPIVGIPLFGCLFALWLTYKIARRLLNFFQLSASI